MLDNSNFPNTFFFKNKLLSLNAVESHNVYGERLMNFSQKQYREWNVMRSKLGAGIKKGIENFGIKRDSLILYLGAASGTTVSHVSDMLDKGFVFAVEFSAQPFSKLLNESKIRNNIVPILSDANKIENYKEIVPMVDIVFQDISQKNQVFIFIENMKRYLKKEGYGYLSLKCKSIDVTRKNKEILDESEEILKDNGFTVIKSISLAPFEKDHYLTIVQFNDSPNKIDVNIQQRSREFDNSQRRFSSNNDNRDSGHFNNNNNKLNNNFRREKKDNVEYRSKNNNSEYSSRNNNRNNNRNSNSENSNNRNDFNKYSSNNRNQERKTNSNSERKSYNNNDRNNRNNKSNDNSNFESFKKSQSNNRR